jgi:4-oxalocrotonate tautomerase
MPFANFKVPAGTLTAEQKELIVHRATDLYAEIYGERARPNTMILVEEVPDGGWGIGDQVLTLAMLQASALQASAPAGQPDVANPPVS